MSDWMNGMTDFQRAEVARLESRIVSFEKRWESLEADWNDCKKALAAAIKQRDEARMKVSAIEAMGYEWRWTRSIDEKGDQGGAWVMRHDAAEADANNKAWDAIADAALAAMRKGGGA